MSEVDGFTETSAVHFGIEDDQEKGQHGKESLKDEGGQSHRFSPYSCYEAGADDSLGKSEHHSEELRGWSHESYMQEIEVAVHDQACSGRVKELYDA